MSLLGEDAAVERGAGFEGSMGFDRKVPSRWCEVVPASRYPASCQTMLEAWGMPQPAPSSTSKTFAPLSAMTLPVFWKMRRSVAVPSM